MNREMESLVDKFIAETKMDDIEIEHFGNHYYVCNDVRQIGEIKKDNDEYYISIQDTFLKSKRFNTRGWC